MWWPFLSVLALFSIRLWCMACPFKLVSRIFGKFGLNAKVPQWLVKNRFIYMALAIFTVHTMVEKLKMTKSASYTASYLLALLVFTAVVSFIFKNNNYCRIFCPLGGLLRIFARIGFMGLEVNDKGTCKKCKSKDCIKNCPVQIPAQILPDASCILCSSCVKKCKSENVAFEISSPFVKKSNGSLKLKDYGEAKGIGEVLIMVVLLGIVMFEFNEWTQEWALFDGWGLLNSILMFVPEKLLVPIGLGKFDFIWEFFICPLVCIVFFSIIVKVIFRVHSVIQASKKYVMCLIPFVYSIFFAGLVHNAMGVGFQEVTESGELDIFFLLIVAFGIFVSGTALINRSIALKTPDISGSGYAQFKNIPVTKDNSFAQKSVVSVDDKLYLNYYKVNNRSHLNIKNMEICSNCKEKTCTHICPASVYECRDENIVISHEGCLECGACKLGCPHNNIDWKYPDGGFGVQYRLA